jgi:ubiquinone/menaquinone biosynthesis C-methylase UbiE
MLHRFLVKLCRRYQSLFPNSHSEEQQLVQLHQKDTMEEFHKAYFQHEMEKGTNCLKRFHQFSQEWDRWKVLDFGCGGGGLTCQLSSRFQEAWGIDIDPEKLAHAEREAAARGQRNVKFCHYDGKQVPFPDESFDCVFCVDVVEHLPDPARFIVDFLRLLRPGGQLLLSFGPPWRHAHGKHMWTHLPGWWTHLLFPRSVVMEVRGFSPDTTWESIGLHRLTVGKFESIMAHSGFETVYRDYQIKKALRPLRSVPWLREFFIAEVIGVFRKPGKSDEPCQSARAWAGTSTPSACRDERILA